MYFQGKYFGTTRKGSGTEEVKSQACCSQTRFCQDSIRSEAEGHAQSESSPDRTIWAAYWPYTTKAPNIAQPFNATKKYVISHARAELSWPNSVLVTGRDIVAEIKKLKAMEAPDLWVYGSSNLIQTLLSHDLVDQMYIWTYPLTLGGGKRLFAEGTLPAAFKLAESKISSSGVIIATYVPTAR